MTTPTREKLASRVKGEPRALSLEEDLLREAKALLDRVTTQKWPSPRWRDDPVGFARDVLGVQLMPHQEEILRALVESTRVAVRSGNKAGKTLTSLVAGLWFYCSFPDARVMLTATTASQVNDVLWRQLKKLLRSSLIPIDGKLGELPRTGLRAEDLRQIVGSTAAEIEAVAGVSGANIFYIVDEASSLEQKFFDAIEGNRAGGGEARVLMISNPTRVEGPYFEAFHGKKAFWHTIHVNCEDVARSNVDRIPGIADADWQAARALEYGIDSVFYRVRIKGEFCMAEGGKAIPFPVIEAARDRWATTEAKGKLRIGLDPAGPGIGGDDTCFAPVRGDKCLDLISESGLNDDKIIARLLGLIRVHRQGDEDVEVVIDAEGPIGGKLLGRLLAIAAGARPGHGFKVVRVYASNAAIREPDMFDRIRDELFACLADWMKTGAIPPDPLLEQELYAPSWIGTIKGKMKLTPKDQIRKMLIPSRSPDRADALALAVWQGAPQWNPGEDPPAQGEPTDAQDAAEAFDMQEGNDPWWPDGGGGNF